MLEVIAGAVPASGARVLAAAVMANHFHIVAQQGRVPLTQLMQPTLRRLAHLLQRYHATDGPMFWRPYACRPCLTPDHARNAIAYVHLNPVRAGICSHPGEYAWSSHALYADSASSSDHLLATVLDPRIALPLFAAEGSAEVSQLRRDYLRFVDWRMTLIRDAGQAGSGSVPIHPGPGPMLAGDRAWTERFSPLFHGPVMPGPAPGRAESNPYTPDLADIARLVIRMEGSQLTIELLRGRGGGPVHTRIRRRIMRRAAAAGHSQAAIARFLCVSESAVSKVVRQPDQAP